MDDALEHDGSAAEQDVDTAAHLVADTIAALLAEEDLFWIVRVVKVPAVWSVQRRTGLLHRQRQTLRFCHPL